MNKIFELWEYYSWKARKSRQMQLRDKTAYIQCLAMRSFAIEEPPSPLSALYATLIWKFVWNSISDSESKKLLKNTFSSPDFPSRDSVCGSEYGKCTSHRDFKGLPPGLKMSGQKVFIFSLNEMIFRDSIIWNFRMPLKTNS